MEETVQLKSECGWPSLFLLFQNGLLMEHVLIFILFPPLALVVCFGCESAEEDWSISHAVKTARCLSLVLRYRLFR